MVQGQVTKKCRRRRPRGLKYKTRLTPAERFDQYVDRSGFCWIWRGAMRFGGYGQFGLHAANKTKTVRAHRYAYERWAGPIPEDLELDHLCRNRRCVNPAHLEPVTRQENLRRSPLGQAAKTCCSTCGGPYSHRSSMRARFCRPCTNRQAMESYYRRKRERGL